MLKKWLLSFKRVTNSSLLLAFCLLILGTGLAQAQERSVLVLEANGPVTPVMANFLERGIATAEMGDYEALLVILDTPGGQIDVTLNIVSSFPGCGSACYCLCRATRGTGRFGRQRHYHGRSRFGHGPQYGYWGCFTR
jgi:hypothetical protein